MFFICQEINCHHQCKIIHLAKGGWVSHLVKWFSEKSVLVVGGLYSKMFMTMSWQSGCMLTSTFSLLHELWRVLQRCIYFIFSFTSNTCQYVFFFFFFLLNKFLSLLFERSIQVHLNFVDDANRYSNRNLFAWGVDPSWCAIHNGTLVSPVTWWVQCASAIPPISLHYHH